MTSTVLIRLEIEGEPLDALHVVGKLLDEGFLQDAVNNHDFDAGALEVLSARAESGGPRRAALALLGEDAVEPLAEFMWNRMSIGAWQGTTRERQDVLRSEARALLEWLREQL